MLSLIMFIKQGNRLFIAKKIQPCVKLGCNQKLPERTLFHNVILETMI